MRWIDCPRRKSIRDDEGWIVSFGRWNSVRWATDDWRIRPFDAIQRYEPKSDGWIDGKIRSLWSRAKDKFFPSFVQ